MNSKIFLLLVLGAVCASGIRMESQTYDSNAVIAQNDFKVLSAHKQFGVGHKFVMVLAMLFTLFSQATGWNMLNDVHDGHGPWRDNFGSSGGHNFRDLGSINDDLPPPAPAPPPPPPPPPPAPNNNQKPWTSMVDDVDENNHGPWRDGADRRPWTADRPSKSGTPGGDAPQKTWKSMIDHLDPEDRPTDEEMYNFFKSIIPPAHRPAKTNSQIHKASPHLDIDRIKLPDLPPFEYQQGSKVPTFNQHSLPIPRNIEIPVPQFDGPRFEPSFPNVNDPVVNIRVLEKFEN